MQWNTVAIVGVGLIGGSIGLALRERKLAKNVVGIGRRQESLARALALGCVTETTTSLAQGVAKADLVIVCTPVDSIVGHVAEALANLKPGAIVTDAGSTKEQLVAEIASELARGAKSPQAFVGSHPIAGSERTGPEAARADLFDGRVAVVTPTTDSDPKVVEQIVEFWQSLGARVVRMSPADHDAALARTSHLPHLVAAALSVATPVECLPLTGSGWADTARVAAGDVELWRQIFLANRAGTLNALADFETVCTRFRNALESADGPALAALLEEGKRRRDAVGS